MLRAAQYCYWQAVHGSVEGPRQGTKDFSSGQPQTVLWYRPLSPRVASHEHWSCLVWWEPPNQYENLLRAWLNDASPARVP